MNDVMQLFEELARRGVKLSVEDGRLKINAARGTITSELGQCVRQNREEIIRLLQDIEPARSTAAVDRLVRDADGDALPFPLSDLQLGFYIANDSYMEYHVRPHYYLEFDHDDLDVIAYEAAWNKALARRRRELCVVNKQIELELLRDPAAIECKVNDLRDLSSQMVQSRLLQVREEMQRQELPLDSWPWLDLRVSVWNEGGRQKARVHYNHNNFFVDGYGTNQLLAEIEGYYRNPDTSLPPLELSYRDAVLGLERLAASPAGEAAKRYWWSRLPDLPPPPALPQRPQFERRCRSRLQRRAGEVEKPLWDAFKRRAAEMGVTPSNAVIAAYAYVVATWSNSDRFIFSQMATRRFAELHPDLTRMLGNFASLYPLEIELLQSVSFVENARHIQARVLEDVKHLQFGGMRVLQELNRLRGSFGTAPSPFVVGSGLFIKKYRKGAFSVLETSQTVLDHQFFELEDGTYYYVWDVLEEAFPAGVIDAMWRAFGGLLHLLVRDADAWHRREFGLVADEDLRDRRQRNGTIGPAPDGALHDALVAQASMRGDRPVLRSAQGVLRYRELDAWSRALARELADRGVEKGDLVPVVMDRDEELLPAVAAVLECGAAYVPIDPRLPRERLAFMLHETGCRLAMTQARYVDSIHWPDGVAPISVSARPSSRPSDRAPDDPTSRAAGSDLAYVIYTSGSTGLPKGVMIAHGAALNTILDVNERFMVGPDDTLFGVSAFNFDLSVYDIFGAIAAGACLVYPRPDGMLDPLHWLDLMLSERVTIWNSVPALMRLLVEAAERRHAVLPALRLVMLSGDKIPLDLPSAITRIAPNAKVVSLGGATEASIWSIFYPIEHVDPAWSTIPYGFPMRNQSWHVRDRHGEPCPTWVPGELYIGGVGLAQGYWRDAEKTGRSFACDPFGERLYRTGDLGRYLPDGCIEWLGRVDSQVKVQGHRIELGEIEAVLSSHPEVSQAVVVLHESPRTGQPSLVAHVVPNGSAPAEVRNLTSFLQGKLPAYMVPTTWRVARELPLTHNGKIDRKALSAASVQDIPAAKQRDRVRPANEVERRVTAIWERILGLPDIGVTDDFFDLGGQSFDAIRVFASIKEEFGRTYTLSDLWRARTVRALAQRIKDGEMSGQEGRVVAIDLSGHGEPLFLVHPAGGSVMPYRRLGTLIDRPVYAIQADAHPVDASSRRDMVSLARQYVSEVRLLAVPGPYVLGGWSSGAMVAFEMAVQLEAAGETVGHVFILDGPAPVRHVDLTDERLLSWFLQDLALGLPVERLDGATLTGLTPAEQLRKAAALMDGAVAALDLEHLLSNYEIFRDVIVAGSRYEPPAISADLTIVRVEDDVVDEFLLHPSRRESDWGWRRFTTGHVHCVRVPGNHYTFLNAPLVDGWCSLLNDVPAIAGRY